MVIFLATFTVALVIGLARGDHRKPRARAGFGTSESGRTAAHVAGAGLILK